MKKKQIDHISNTMSKHQDSLTKNFITFFSNAGKMENGPSLGDYIHVIFIS